MLEVWARTSTNVFDLLNIMQCSNHLRDCVRWRLHHDTALQVQGLRAMELGMADRSIKKPLMQQLERLFRLRHVATLQDCPIGSNEDAFRRMQARACAFARHCRDSHVSMNKLGWYHRTYRPNVRWNRCACVRWSSDAAVARRLVLLEELTAQDLHPARGQPQNEGETNPTHWNWLVTLRLDGPNTPAQVVTTRKDRKFGVWLAAQLPGVQVGDVNQCRPLLRHLFEHGSLETMERIEARHSLSASPGLIAGHMLDNIVSTLVLREPNILRWFCATFHATLAAQAPHVMVSPSASFSPYVFANVQWLRATHDITMPQRTPDIILSHAIATAELDNDERDLVPQDEFERMQQSTLEEALPRVRNRWEVCCIVLENIPSLEFVKHMVQKMDCRPGLAPPQVRTRLIDTALLIAQSAMSWPTVWLVQWLLSEWLQITPLENRQFVDALVGELSGVCDATCLQVLMCRVRSNTDNTSVPISTKIQVLECIVRNDEEDMFMTMLDVHEDLRSALLNPKTWRTSFKRMVELATKEEATRCLDRLLSVLARDEQETGVSAFLHVDEKHMLMLACEHNSHTALQMMFSAWPETATQVAMALAVCCIECGSDMALSELMANVSLTRLDLPRLRELAVRWAPEMTRDAYSICHILRLCEVDPADPRCAHLVANLAERMMHSDTTRQVLTKLGAVRPIRNTPDAPRAGGPSATGPTFAAHTWLRSIST